MKNQLIIKNLFVQTLEDKKILNGINLTIAKGETHVLMGPNGSGKSTLASALMGHTGYKITSGEIILNGENITNLSPDKRSKAGLFLSFQYPVEISGVNFSSFLRMAANESLLHRDKKSKRISPIAFNNQLMQKAKDLSFNSDISQRSLNEGFSGGEKKKAEILQLAILKPDFAVLDEPDSGLDIDALKHISNSLNGLDFKPGLLLITHYQRILHFIKPDFVHIMIKGKIVKSGKFDLAIEIEKTGYGKYLKSI